MCRLQSKVKAGYLHKNPETLKCVLLPWVFNTNNIELPIFFMRSSPATGLDGIRPQTDIGSQRIRKVPDPLDDIEGPNKPLELASGLRILAGETIEPRENTPLANPWDQFSPASWLPVSEGKPVPSLTNLKFKNSVLEDSLPDPSSNGIAELPERPTKLVVSELMPARRSAFGKLSRAFEDWEQVASRGIKVYKLAISSLLEGAFRYAACLQQEYAEVGQSMPEASLEAMHKFQTNLVRRCSEYAALIGHLEGEIDRFQAHIERLELLIDMVESLEQMLLANIDHYRNFFTQIDGMISRLNRKARSLTENSESLLLQDQGELMERSESFARPSDPEAFGKLYFQMDKAHMEATERWFVDSNIGDEEEDALSGRDNLTYKEAQNVIQETHDRAKCDDGADGNLENRAFAVALEAVFQYQDEQIQILIAEQSNGGSINEDHLQRMLEASYNTVRWVNRQREKITPISNGLGNIWEMCLHHTRGRALEEFFDPDEREEYLVTRIGIRDLATALENPHFSDELAMKLWEWITVSFFYKDVNGDFLEEAIVLLVKKAFKHYSKMTSPPLWILKGPSYALIEKFWGDFDGDTQESIKELRNNPIYNTSLIHNY
jgi:hypothetical protein